MNRFVLILAVILVLWIFEGFNLMFLRFTKAHFEFGGWDTPYSALFLTFLMLIWVLAWHSF